MSSRVLLVEDEPALAGLLSRFLARAGYEVVCCSTGAEAKASWESSFSAAIVDLGLPDMPGEQLVGELAAAVAWKPIVVSSGSPAAAEQMAVDGRRVHFLQKPYLPAELLKTLSAALEA